MKVGLFFLQPDDRPVGGVMHSLYGRFNVGGFLFIDEKSITMFKTKSGDSYGKYHWKDGAILSGRYECLLISADEGERHRLWTTCEACAIVKKPFNMRDLLLMHLPFREVEDLPIDRAPTLNNAQAIILILRECLNPDNRLREGIEGLHSRQTLLEDLYDRLQPFAVPVTSAQITALVRLEMDDLQGNPHEQH